MEIKPEACDLSRLAASVAGVSLTLPSFWPLNADAWFIKVEAQFTDARITNEQTKFNKVLAVLPENIAIQVRDITTKTTYASGDYELLKQKLINRCQPSVLERLDRLGELKEIASKKPSDVLVDLESIIIASSDELKMPMSDIFKKYWWLRALPKSIQVALLPIVDKCDLPALAQSADQIYNACPPLPTIAATTSEKDENQGLVEQVIAAIKSQDSQRRQQRSTHQAKSSLLCRFHVKFGDQARRCEPGCSRFKTMSKNE